MYITVQEPKQYKVIDKNNNNVIEVFDDLNDVYAKINEYTLKKYGEALSALLQDNAKDKLIKLEKIVGYKADYTAEPNALGQVPIRPIVKKKQLYGLYVVDALGEIIPKVSIKAYYKRFNSNKYEESDKIRNQIFNGLLFRKDNINKTKKTYLAHMSSYGELKLNCRWKRPAKLFQIVRKFDSVIKDDFEPKVRGSTKELPNLWDGSRNNNGHNFKSWKHNSKRRKQWKVKSNVNI